MYVCMLDNECFGKLCSVGRKHWRHVRRSTTRVLVVNLAISDLMVSIVAMPFELAEESTGRWMVGVALCKLIEFIQAVGFAVNVISVTFIALDRYLILSRPVTWKQHTQHTKIVKYMVAFSWIFPSILCGPFLYIYDVVEVLPNKNQVCSTISLPHKALDQSYWGLEIYYLYLVPFVVIVLCYVGILRHVIKMKNLGEPSSTENSKESRLHLIKTKASRLALAMVTMFLICWAPSLVALCLRINRGSAFVHRTSVAYEVALFMAYVNEAINPILYGYFDSLFNSKFCASLQRFGCKQFHGHVSESTDADEL